MATQFDDTQTFTQDADTVMRMFCDRSYFERKYQQTAESYEILECEQTADHFRIKARLKMRSSAPLPGFAKKFVAETMTVVQEDSWDANTRRGQLSVEIAGAPVSIQADMALVEQGEGAANKMHWTVTCKVPLVGGKLEKLIADDIRQKAPRDLEVSRELVADY